MEQQLQQENQTSQNRDNCTANAPRHYTIEAAIQESTGKPKKEGHSHIEEGPHVCKEESANDQGNYCVCPGRDDIKDYSSEDHLGCDGNDCTQQARKQNGFETEGIV